MAESNQNPTQPEPDQMKKQPSGCQPKICRPQDRPKVKKPRPVRPVHPWRAAAAELLQNLADAWPWMSKANHLARRQELRDEYEKRLAARNEAIEKQALELVRLQQVIDHHLHPLIELERLHQDRTQLIIRCQFAASWFARLGQVSQERLGTLSPARQVEFTQIDVEMSFIDMYDIMDLTEKCFALVFKEIPVLDVDGKT